METSLYVIILLVTLALLFDFMNGFHDAANAIATIVSTGVLRPGQAVALAAIFNMAAFFVFNLSVAKTIGKGTIDPSVIDHYVVFGALVGAIFWNLVTWYFGIPSSSSHALIGGLIGAAVAKEGTGALIAAGLYKIITFIVLSPLIGFILGSLLMLIVSWIFVRTTPLKVDKWFRRLQLVSASAFSLGHGGNDSQKTIGIIWLILISGGYVSSTSTSPGYWVVLACYSAIALGTIKLNTFFLFGICFNPSFTKYSPGILLLNNLTSSLKYKYRVKIIFEPGKSNDNVSSLTFPDIFLK